MRTPAARPSARALLAAAVTGVLLSAAPAAPAAAAGTCSVVIATNLAVDSPFERFPAHLGTDCDGSGTAYASWDIRHSYYGPTNILIFDGTTDEYWDFYDWEDLGTHYVEPSLAYDYAYDDVAQNTRTVYVRLGSRLSLSGARSGSYVTLTAKATRYNPSAAAFGSWRSKAVALQYKTCSTCAWATRTTVTTGTAGTASYRFYMPKARYYRAVTASTSVTWGKTSATTYR